MQVKIYTDGAARGNPDGPGGYGAILHYVDTKGSFMKESCPEAIKNDKQPDGADGGHCGAGGFDKALSGGSLFRLQISGGCV